MMTLDEVIESITTQSGLEIRNVRKPERDRFWVDRDTYNDALRYLREYRDKMANNEEAYKRGYSCGYEKAKEDEAESRRWDESYRASQMPWNHGYCEMGG